MPAAPARPGWASFRTKLLVAMMLVVTTVTALALFFAQRRVAGPQEHAGLGLGEQLETQSGEPAGHALDRPRIHRVEPGEDADIFGYFLLQVEPESIFESSVTAS